MATRKNNNNIASSPSTAGTPNLAPQQTYLPKKTPKKSSAKKVAEPKLEKKLTSRARSRKPTSAPAGMSVNQKVDQKSVSESPTPISKRVETPAMNQKTKKLAKVQPVPRPQANPNSKLSKVSVLPSSSLMNITHALDRANLISKVKEFHAHFSVLVPQQIIPAPALKAEQALQECLLSLHSSIDLFDDFVDSVYQGSDLNLEQKAMLREALVKLFSVSFGASNQSAPPLYPFTKHPHHRYKHRDDQYIVDVFALPVFGSSDSMKKLLANQKILNQLCNLTIDSGYLSPDSDCVAFLSAPLDWRALSRPSVLNALCSMWGELIVHGGVVDETTTRHIRQAVYEQLKPFTFLDGNQVGGFVLPGVRVWKKTYSSYQKADELFGRWTQVDQERKTSAQIWWQTVAGHLTLAAGVDPGSLMIRPPVRPLVAQAQALSWHLTQQVYDRLGTMSFSEINFITVSEHKLALRAYDHRRRVVASSDVVDVFDVVTSSDDFSELMQNECSDKGPRTQLREKIRSLSLRAKN